MQAAGLAGQAFDRAGNGDGGDHAAGRAADGRRNGGDPRLAFPEALGPAPASYSGQDGGREAGGLEAFEQAVVVLPRQQHLGGGAGLHGELGADRDGVPEADGPLGGGDADAPVALAAEDLGALAGGVAQLHQHRAGGRDQPVFASCGGEFDQAAAEHETPLDVAAHQTVVDERQREAVHRGPREAGGGNELRQGGGAGLERVEYMGRFIDDADATRIVHVMILPSQYLRCKSLRWHI